MFNEHFAVEIVTSKRGSVLFHGWESNLALVAVLAASVDELDVVFAFGLTFSD